MDTISRELLDGENQRILMKLSELDPGSADYTTVLENLSGIAKIVEADDKIDIENNKLRLEDDKNTEAQKFNRSQSSINMTMKAIEISAFLLRTGIAIIANRNLQVRSMKFELGHSFSGKGATMWKANQLPNL